MTPEPIRGAFAAKLEPLHKVVFSAFQLSDPAIALDPGKAHHVGDFATLEEAIERAAVRHKQHVMVRERDEFTGATTLRFYRIKQRSQPIYVRKPGMAHTVAERPLYPEHLFDLALTPEVTGLTQREAERMGSVL